MTLQRRELEFLELSTANSGSLVGILATEILLPFS